MGRARAYAWVLAVLVIGAFPAVAQAAAAPNPVGELDCNGLSPIQASAHPTAACADPRGTWHGRFYEHGHYIGHDEPSVRFISNTPGSGDGRHLTSRGSARIPAAADRQDNPGSDVTHFFELSVAPWFSMDLCDPNSSPLTPCTPVRTRNAPTASFPGGGDAFMELQFYPPGFAPFSDNISCDNTHWCSALNIDSLECNADLCNVQRQLRGAGQLRLHPAQRRSHRAAEPSGVGSGDVHAERRHAADEPRRHDRHPHLRRQAERGWPRARSDRATT